MIVRANFHEGETWPQELKSHPEASAYPDLAALADGAAMCLYERGNEHPDEQIALARFTLDDFQEDHAKPGSSHQ